MVGRRRGEGPSGRRVHVVRARCGQRHLASGRRGPPLRHAKRVGRLPGRGRGGRRCARHGDRRAGGARRAGRREDGGGAPGGARSTRRVGADRALRGALRGGASRVGWEEAWRVTRLGSRVGAARTRVGGPRARRAHPGGPLAARLAALPDADRGAAERRRVDRHHGASRAGARHVPRGRGRARPGGRADATARGGRGGRRDAPGSHRRHGPLLRPRRPRVARGTARGAAALAAPPRPPHRPDARRDVAIGRRPRVPGSLRRALHAVAGLHRARPRDGRRGARPRDARRLRRPRRGHAGAHPGRGRPRRRSEAPRRDRHGPLCRRRAVLQPVGRRLACAPP